MSGRLAVLALVFSSALCAAEESLTVPFITTPDEVVHRMLALAQTRPGDLVADLGSGDGRIVIAAAQQFGARGLGIELDAGLVERSRENAARAGVADRVSFVQGDVLGADISAASVVTVYLLPDLMNRLQPRFLQRLQPGTRIVSHAFTMTGWRPDGRETMHVEKAHPGQGDESSLYLWIVPAEVRGVWQASGQAGTTRIRIYQNFQDIELEGRLLGREITSSRATLRGRDIAWEADGSRFEGRLEGGRIAGELIGAQSRQPLVLERAR
ncbi:MAG TPA: class I SAM-dependent methyltransferase [Burkholderiales bacterium]